MLSTESRPHGVVAGSRVTLSDVDSGAVFTCESPPGSALIGRRAGELVLADTPTGDTRRLRILVIQTAPR